MKQIALILFLAGAAHAQLFGPPSKLKSTSVALDPSTCTGDGDIGRIGVEYTGAGSTFKMCVKTGASTWVYQALSSSGSVGVSSFNGRIGAVVPANGDYNGTAITNTPAGNIAATTVAAALAELDAEKQALDADLTQIAALSCTDGQIPKKAGGVWTCAADGGGGGGGGTLSSVGLALPAIFSVSGSPLTADGTITATLANQSANLIFAGPSSGGAAAPTFRALVAADLPVGTTAGTVAAGDHAHQASAVVNAPTPSISATTVQGAIDELSSEKQNVDGDLTDIAALNCADGEIMKKTAGVWACAADGGGGGAGSSAGQTFAQGATSGTLTHNLGSATHTTTCHDGTTGLPVMAAFTRGTNADVFTFTGGLANATTCIATAGGAGGGGGASTALSTLFSLGASGSAKTVDPANGWTQTMTLSANCTVTLTQPSAGTFANVRIGVTQAASGGPYTVTFTGAKWPGGIAPVMSAGASKVDWYSCLLDGTNAFCTAGQDFQ